VARSSRVARTIVEIQELADRLLTQPFLDVDRLRVPLAKANGPGVYMVRHAGRIIYIGDATNLRRRLWSNHIRGSRQGYGNSQFRKLLQANLDVPPGEGTTNWIRENCRFAFLEIDDPDAARALEAVMIRALTPHLRNKDRGQSARK
jgi:hypothetical protein